MKKIGYVEPILCAYFFNIGMDMFTSKQLIFKKVCIKRFNDTYCDVISQSSNNSFKDDINFLHNETAEWDLYLNIARTLPAVFVTVFLGTWSDKVGRKMVIILPVLGDMAGFLFFLISSIYLELSLYYLIIACLISGFFGNFTAMLQATCAYVADVSLVEERTTRIAFLEFMNHFGRIMSPAIAGVLIQKKGFTAVYITLVVISSFQLIYWFFLKESRQFDVCIVDNKFKELVKFQRIKDALNVFFKKRDKSHRVLFYLLVGAFILDLFVLMGILSILVLYFLHFPLNLSSSQIGYFFMEMNAARALGVLVMNTILIKYFHWRDFSFIILCGISYIGFSLFIALSSKIWHTFAAGALAVFTSVGMPATRSALSKITNSEEQGCMFSMFSCLEVLVVLAAGTMYNAVYEHTVDALPSLIFYIMVGLAAVLTGIGITLVRTDASGKYDTLFPDFFADSHNSQK
ncbi:proton-coupled folate transporter [Hydra vulgaris]|uniref:Proton-coupled folate transporter n=1 Tax=Hydra vulgaris TaxID=6087 RepID=A0ABM4D7F9_HYDVU